MAIRSGFFNAQMDVNNQPDRVYSAEDMSRFFVGLFTDGVFNNIGDRFEVKENATDRTYVKTGTGKAWYNGMWFISDDINEKIQVLAAEQSVNRIDALCIHFNYSLRNVYFDWIKGTAPSNGNASPSKPMISSGYMPIAYITRRAQSSGVTNTDIELAVGVDSKTPLVANALARELNYSSYYTTFQNTFNNYLQGNKDAWNSWFGSTASSAGSVRKAWTDWFGSTATASGSVRKAWTDWFGSSATASGSVRKTWSDYLTTCGGEWSDFKTEKANDYSLMKSNFSSNWNTFLQARQSEWQSWFGSTATASGSVRKAWTDWFGASDSTGIKKTFWDWFGSTDSAGIKKTFWDWLGTSNSAGIKKTFWDWLGTDNTKGIKKTFWDWFGTSDSYGIRKDYLTWKSNKINEQDTEFHQWFEGYTDGNNVYHLGVKDLWDDWFNDTTNQLGPKYEWSRFKGDCREEWGDIKQDWEDWWNDVKQDYADYGGHYETHMYYGRTIDETEDSTVHFSDSSGVPGSNTTASTNRVYLKLYDTTILRQRVPFMGRGNARIGSDSSGINILATGANALKVGNPGSNTTYSGNGGSATNGNVWLMLTGVKNTANSSYTNDYILNKVKITGSGATTVTNAIDNGINTITITSNYYEACLTSSVSTSTSQDCTLTFSNAAITPSKMIDVYTDNYAVQYKSISVSNGSCTLTFPKQSSSFTLQVKLVIR